MNHLSSKLQQSHRNEYGFVALEYMLAGMVVMVITAVLIPFIHSNVVEYVTVMNETLGSIGNER